MNAKGYLDNLKKKHPRDTMDNYFKKGANNNSGNTCTNNPFQNNEPPMKRTKLEERDLELIRNIVEKRCYDDDNLKPFFEVYMNLLEDNKIFTRYDWNNYTTKE